MTKLSEQILKLRDQGYTYDQIQKQLNCSKCTISYHCGKGQKQKSLQRQQKRRKKHPFISKMEHFIYKKTKQNLLIKSSIERRLYEKYRAFLGRKIMTKRDFTLDELIKKIGDNPKCYLTGEDIDLSKPSTYQFDHIIPKSRGGDNSLDNLGICTKRANQSKNNMTPDEFINLCKKVVEYNKRNS